MVNIVQVNMAMGILLMNGTVSLLMHSPLELTQYQETLILMKLSTGLLEKTSVRDFVTLLWRILSLSLILVNSVTIIQQSNSDSYFLFYKYVTKVYDFFFQFFFCMVLRNHDNLYCKLISNAVVWQGVECKLKHSKTCEQAQPNMFFQV